MTCQFFVPGPTWVRPEILGEMTRPMIGHRSAEFRELFTGIATDLKPLFGTAQDTFVATCSGTGMLEAALINSATRRVLVTFRAPLSARRFRIREPPCLGPSRAPQPPRATAAPA